MIADLAQAQILIGGILAITLIADTRPRVQWWGFLVGLSNQWAWYYTAFSSEPWQWGVATINIAYCFNYVRGLKNRWAASRGE